MDSKKISKKGLIFGQQKYHDSEDLQACPFTDYFPFIIFFYNQSFATWDTTRSISLRFPGRFLFLFFLRYLSFFEFFQTEVFLSFSCRKMPIHMYKNRNRASGLQFNYFPLFCLQPDILFLHRISWIHYPFFLHVLLPV